MTQFNPDDIKLPAEWPGQVKTAVRMALNTLGGYLFGKGLLTHDQFAALVSLGIPLVMWAWAAIDRHLHHKALNAAILAPAGQAQ